MDTQMAMEPSTTTNDNTIEIPQVDWLQQMYDLDSIQWKGGDNFFEGASSYVSPIILPMLTQISQGCMTVIAMYAGVA